MLWSHGTAFSSDGHNRLEICEKHQLPCRTVEADLPVPDRDAAKAWIITNQFGRRNLSPFQRAELALKLEPIIAARAKENQRTHTEQGYQKSDKAAHTLPELAQISGLSHDTIHKAKVISERATEEAKERLREGDTTIHREYTLIQPPKEPAPKKSKKSEPRSSEIIDTTAESLDIELCDYRGCQNEAFQAITLPVTAAQCT